MVAAVAAVMAASLPAGNQILELRAAFGPPFLLAVASHVVSKDLVDAAEMAIALRFNEADGKQPTASFPSILCRDFRRVTDPWFLADSENWSA